ncbi:MAG: hypothetical protein QOE13_1168 [Gaiellaceae bacterium]|jgi:hypothetical protein|nr:hypothetical protein [Gaiellaceae bacterium]
MFRARALVLLVGVVGVLTFSVSSAAAHQTLVNNRVAVTLHVAPNDEPVAGEQTTVWIVRIGTSKGKFTWSRCKCTLKIFKPDGTVLLDGKAPRKTQFTFPDIGAYGITVAGRVRRNNAWAAFKVTFGIRAF